MNNTDGGRFIESVQWFYFVSEVRNISSKEHYTIPLKLVGLFGHTNNCAGAVGLCDRALWRENWNVAEAAC